MIISIFVCFCDKDPIPHFNLSVNESSKSIAVTVEPGNKVYAMWCYQKSPQHCMNRGQAPRITVSFSGTFMCTCIVLYMWKKCNVFVCSVQIDPSQNPTALLNIPYLLPCVCVQVLSSHKSFLFSFFYTSSVIIYSCL